MESKEREGKKTNVTDERNLLADALGRQFALPPSLVERGPLAAGVELEVLPGEVRLDAGAERVLETGEAFDPGEGA